KLTAPASTRTRPPLWNKTDRWLCLVPKVRLRRMPPASWFPISGSRSAVLPRSDERAYRMREFYCAVRLFRRRYLSCTGDASPTQRKVTERMIGVEEDEPRLFSAPFPEAGYPDAVSVGIALDLMEAEVT